MVFQPFCGPNMTMNRGSKWNKHNWSSWSPSKSLENTAKLIWDRSIFSIIKPSFEIILFQDFWRFARNLQHMNARLFLLLFLNNFAFICCKVLENLCKFLENLCKSSEILEKCHNDGSNIEIIAQSHGD